MSRFIAVLPPIDRKSLARRYRVTLRSVERWSADIDADSNPIERLRPRQFRNFIPSPYWVLAPEDLPGPMINRFNDALLLANFCEANISGAGKTGTYEAGTGSLETALMLATAYRLAELGDPFKDETTIGIRIIPKGGGRWKVEIDYELDYDAAEGGFAYREWDDNFIEDLYRY